MTYQYKADRVYFIMYIAYNNHFSFIFYLAMSGNH